METFDSAVCISADFGLDYVPFVDGSFADAKSVFDRRMSGDILTDWQADLFITYMMIYISSKLKLKKWTMMLHFGALRNVNTSAFRISGPDFGYDAISQDTRTGSLALFLDHLNSNGILPHTILFSLSPGDDAVLDTLCGCFSEAGSKGLVQHGVSWWFNDTLQGIRDHLVSYAALGVLGNHLGMLTDSRSLLSYVRHDYFRMILCDLLGEWTEKGQLLIPEEKTGELIRDICYGNIKSYLGLVSP